MKPYYQDEQTTIYHGDCHEIMPHLPMVDLVQTDPPYFQPATHYVPTRTQGVPKKSIGDMSILELAFKIWCGDLARLLRPTGTIYFFCDGQSYPLAFTALYPHAKHVRPLIWDKMISYNGYTWRHQHELIAWAEMEESPRIETGDGDILRFRGVMQDDRLHPAEKPLDLFKALVAKHAVGIVLDPFMGSGTTLRAAKDLGRKAIGIEIEERYCEIAVKRLAQEVLPLDAMVNTGYNNDYGTTGQQPETLPGFHGSLEISQAGNRSHVFPAGTIPEGHSRQLWGGTGGSLEGDEAPRHPQSEPR